MRIGACAASTLLWRCAPAACWAPNLNVCPVRSGSVRCLCRRSPRRERLRVGTTTQYTVRCCRCRCRCLQSAAHGSDTALTQARKSARVFLLLTDNAVSRHTALLFVALIFTRCLSRQKTPDRPSCSKQSQQATLSRSHNAGPRVQRPIADCVPHVPPLCPPPLTAVD